MDISPYLILVALALLVIALLAVGARLVMNMRRPRGEALARGADVSSCEYYTGTLRQAADIVGGEANLATELKTSPDTLRRWLSGEESPPIDVYLAALDLITRGNHRSSKQETHRHGKPEP